MQRKWETTSFAFERRRFQGPPPRAHSSSGSSGSRSRFAAVAAARDLRRLRRRQPVAKRLEISESLTTTGALNKFRGFRPFACLNLRESRSRVEQPLLWGEFESPCARALVNLGARRISIPGGPKPARPTRSTCNARLKCKSRRPPSGPSQSQTICCPAAAPRTPPGPLHSPVSS